MQLDVAAYGWLDESWTPSYPDDMPLEWRLDYYANEYRAAVVPYAHWSGRDDESLLEWVEEAHQAFEFYWELACMEDAQRLLALYQAHEGLSPPGGWLVLPGATISPSVEQELSALAPVAQCVAKGECSGGVTIVAVEEGVNLRQLREQLDALKAKGVTLALLVVMPSPGAASTLEQVQILCQLYAG